MDVDSTESQVESVPQSPVEEQGLQNLPDCVPLEIRSKYSGLVVLIWN